MNRNRIVWLDIAKCIGIISVIIGHTFIPGEDQVANLVYTFHMPLFFILTGITIKDSSHIRKDIFSLLVPCIVIYIVKCAIDFFFLHLPLDIVVVIKSIIFAYCGDINGIKGIGILWFLITLFSSKILYYFISSIFKQKEYIIFIFLAIFGYLVSNICHLPFRIDTALVGSLFIYIGHVFGKYQIPNTKYQIPATVVCFIIWTLAWSKGIFISLAYWSYTPLMIIVSILGSLCVIALSITLETNAYISKILSKIGRYSMVLYVIHFFDGYWKVIWLRDNKVVCALLRIMMNVLILYIIIFSKKIFETKFKRSYRILL